MNEFNLQVAVLNHYNNLYYQLDLQHHLGHLHNACYSHWHRNGNKWNMVKCDHPSDHDPWPVTIPNTGTKGACDASRPRLVIGGATTDLYWYIYCMHYKPPKLKWRGYLICINVQQLLYSSRECLGSSWLSI